MLRSRVGRYTAGIREALARTVAEDHTPGEIAGRFAVGTFITMLPTLGTGLLAFGAIAFLSARVSKLALLASVVVFNPVVKWGVYVASFGFGVLLLGPVPGVDRTEVSFTAGPEIVARLLVGNLILAVVATAVGYVVVRRLALAYERSEVADVVEDAVEELVE